MRNRFVRSSGPTEFEQLARVDRDLSLIGIEAGGYVRSDPVACLMKLRLFAELAAKGVGARNKVPRMAFETADAYLDRLETKGALPKRISRLFHSIRIAGNGASHGKFTRRDAAESALGQAKELAIWYFQLSAGNQSRQQPRSRLILASPTPSTFGMNIKETRAETMRNKRKEKN